MTVYLAPVRNALWHVSMPAMIFCIKFKAHCLIDEILFLFGKLVPKESDGKPSPYKRAYSL